MTEHRSERSSHKAVFISTLLFCTASAVAGASGLSEGPAAPPVELPPELSSDVQVIRVSRTITMGMVGGHWNFSPYRASKLHPGTQKTKLGIAATIAPGSIHSEDYPVDSRRHDSFNLDVDGHAVYRCDCIWKRSYAAGRTAVECTFRSEADTGDWTLTMKSELLPLVGRLHGPAGDIDMTVVTARRGLLGTLPEMLLFRFEEQSVACVQYATGGTMQGGKLILKRSLPEPTRAAIAAAMVAVRLSGFDPHDEDDDG